MVKNFCYLGVLISDDCKHDNAIDKERKLLYARGNKLIRLFSHCSKDVKIKLFRTYCTSFYCASLWSNFSSNSFKRIKVAHNTIFKVLMKADGYSSASRLFVEYNVPNTDVITRKLSCSLYNRILHSDNNMVKVIVDSLYFNTSLLYKHWLEQLFFLK